MNNIKFKMEIMKHPIEKAACLYMTTGDFEEDNTYNCAFTIADSIEDTLREFQNALNAMMSGYYKMVDGEPVYTKLKFTLHKIEENI